MKYIQDLRNNLVNIPGWRTKRKIVVFESDDWGSIRMSSQKAFDNLRKAGYSVDSNYFTKNDILECSEDLELLFAVLSSYRDKNGNYPCITANAVTANPDFEKIKEDSFANYYKQIITETYSSYDKQGSTLDTWKQGIKDHLLYPQFHGREHLNIWEWMRILRTGNHREIQAFNNKCILGLGGNVVSQRPDEYMAAFSFESEEEKNTHKYIITEGLDLFEKIFGFRSVSFIAPCGVHPLHLDSVLRTSGVKYIQGGRQYNQKEEGKLVPTNRFWGYKNSEGQYFWRRNATFEPSRNPDFDWVSSVLSEIQVAFRWGKPAVINSHRVNYVGSINTANRDNTLRLLKLLLSEILKKYPQVEFMSSDQLGDLISQNNQNP